jgi:hypothetical protein
MPGMKDRRGHLIGSACVAVALVAVALAVVVPRLRGDHRPAAAGTARPGESPFDTASRMLGDQARALLAGDETGWLAPIDPSRSELVVTYRSMYASLRALEVTDFAYRPSLLSDANNPALSIDGNVGYCFADCSHASSVDRPDAHQRLTVKRIDGRLRITDMAQYQQDDRLAPAPWEAGPLVVKRGARVTVAAPRSEAAHVDQVLSIAERAASTTDRFAGYVGNPQRRYRIYLADDAGWANWYGGSSGDGVAYTMPLPGNGADIVLRIEQIGNDQQWLPFTVRSQLGRVVTLEQKRSGYGENDWLSDGVGDWIGWWPNPARSGPWLADVRKALRGAHPPTTIALPPLDAGASPAEVRAFFGLGQFAVDCLARKYGEPALFAFVKAVLIARTSTLDASRQAFHTPFEQVDNACVTWIRQQAA